MTAGGRIRPQSVPSRLSPALVAILARMVEAKLAAAASPPVVPASLPAQSEGMVGPPAGDPAGQDGG